MIKTSDYYIFENLALRNIKIQGGISAYRAYNRKIFHVIELNSNKWKFTFVIDNGIIKTTVPDLKEIDPLTFEHISQALKEASVLEPS